MTGHRRSLAADWHGVEIVWGRPRPLPTGKEWAVGNFNVMVNPPPHGAVPESSWNPPLVSYEAFSLGIPAAFPSPRRLGQGRACK